MGQCCETECSSITLPSSTDVDIQYSTDGTTWTTTATGALYIRFTLDGGETWESTITLPVAQISNVLHWDSNGTTGYTSTNTILGEYLGTEYTMDNVTDLVMDTVGDFIEIEAYFEVPANANERTLIIKGGIASPATTNFAYCSFIPVINSIVKLNTKLYRVGNTGNQMFESSSTTLVSPSFDVAFTSNTVNRLLTNVAIDFTVPNNIYIRPWVQQLGVASLDVVLRYMCVKRNPKT